MTAACFQILRWTPLIDWSQTLPDCLARLMQQVQTQLIHWDELQLILQAQRYYYEIDHRPTYFGRLGTDYVPPLLP